MDTYKVKKLNHPINLEIAVPGSKSITNRALFLAALGNGAVHLKGVLFSEDSRYFLSSLKSLGFSVEIREEEKEVTVGGCGGMIPKKEAEIYVGSAGTAARFLTAMLALSEGVYTIQASEQMKRRPMRPLFEALEQSGAEFTYLEKEGFLPVRVRGKRGGFKEASLDISRSTQFLSALLMMAPVLGEDFTIHITSEKKDGSYIRITRKLMEQFGVECNFDGDSYHIKKGQQYQREVYEIEPDVSAACYFYAMAALTGGSKNPRPGEISLAHYGVLFLDELPEFRRDVLEALRQPMEDRKVTISRVNGTVTYPSEFMLVAAMNPCPCGYLGDERCHCSNGEISRYRNRISGPLMDRIDIFIETPDVKYDELNSNEVCETSADIKKRVAAARDIQLRRYKKEGIFFNSQLSAAQTAKYCVLEKDAEEFVKTAFENLKLSARAYHKILKLSRTIADIDGSKKITLAHAAEALQYRGYENT